MVPSGEGSRSLEVAVVDNAWSSGMLGRCVSGDESVGGVIGPRVEDSPASVWACRNRWPIWWISISLYIVFA
jgi:hypothetical protein